MQKLSGLCLVAVFLASGCATSLSPPESSTSLTKGPQAITIVDADEIRLRQLFVRGLTRALVDDHKQAIFLFEQAIQIDGAHPAIHIALAEAHAALGELDTSIYYASTAAKLDRKNRTYTVYLGELLHRNNDIEEAIALFEDWIKAHPEDLETRLKVADLIAETGRNDEALDRYRDLLGGQSDELQVRYRMLQIHNGRSDLEEMRKTVKRMLEIDSTNNSLRHLLSEIYVELDSTATAIDVLEKAVADDPTDVTTTLSLSKLYREHGRDRDADILIRASSNVWEPGTIDKMALASDLYARSASDVLARQRAEELLDALLEEGIETPEVLYMLGDLKYRSAEYPHAGPLLLQAAELEPRRMEAWTKAALSFLKAGTPARALDATREALILFPGQYALLRIAGQAALRIGRPEEAIDFAASALKVVDPRKDNDVQQTSEMLLLQASAYRQLGLPEGAEQSLRQVLDLQVNQREARYWLVFSLLEQDGRTDEARMLAEELVFEDPSDPLSLDAMAWIALTSGNLTKALDLLLRAVDLMPDDARSQEHLGDVFSALGEHESARTHWQRALEIDPGRVALRAKLKQLP